MKKTILIICILVFTILTGCSSSDNFESDNLNTTDNIVINNSNIDNAQVNTKITSNDVITQDDLDSIEETIDELEEFDSLGSDEFDISFE